jgi:hypothetical protein
MCFMGAYVYVALYDTVEHLGCSTIDFILRFILFSCVLPNTCSFMVI